MVKQTSKKVLGVVLIIIGLLALVTPLTPGAWLAFVGLELLGIRLAAKDRVMEWLGRKPKSPTDQKPPEA
ncbi:MAG: PGPGW domain-containing protein [Patescibacteria group bacterium]